MKRLIQQYEQGGYFDDEDDELFDIPDDYDDTPNPEHIAYAKSLVGKYCTSITHSISYLDNLLCRVICVNDNKRGGNTSQVLMRVYRSNGMWEFRRWWFIGTDRQMLECVDSHHLTETMERPTINEYIASTLSAIARIITANLSTEHTSFKYGWWHDEYMWRHISPLSSLLAAFCDLPRAFKYGVYIRRFREMELVTSPD